MNTVYVLMKTTISARLVDENGNYAGDAPWEFVDVFDNARAAEKAKHIRERLSEKHAAEYGCSREKFAIDVRPLHSEP